ncbi:zinc finger domain-containing protein [Roseomonas mucosa]|uniref:zinc finger domain-containing protein n=1 Tax=Roseomonas mucosa TaxID=207340 RepID=UPI003340DE0A
MEIRRLALRPATAQSSRLPVADAGGPVACTRCGGAYEHDPTLRVGCPACAAAPSQPCHRPANGGVRQSHLSRGREALASGRMPACGALTWDGLHAFAVPVPVRAPGRHDAVHH